MIKLIKFRVCPHTNKERCQITERKIDFTHFLFRFLDEILTKMKLSLVASKKKLQDKLDNTQNMPDTTG